MPLHASKISKEAIRRPKIREIWPLSQPADNEKVADFRNFPHFPGLTKVPLLVTLVGHFGLVRRPLCYSSSATLHSKKAVRLAQNSRRATPKSPSELFKVAIFPLPTPKMTPKSAFFSLESIAAEGGYFCQFTLHFVIFRPFASDIFTSKNFAVWEKMTNFVPQ